MSTEVISNDKAKVLADAVEVRETLTLTGRNVYQIWAGSRESTRIIMIRADCPG
jgi:hypothetical protein